MNMIWRLRTAWAALRGDNLLTGISIENGTVMISRGNTFMRNAKVTGCTIRLPRPAVFEVDTADQFTGNSGPGIAGVRYRKKEDRGH